MARKPTKEQTKDEKIAELEARIIELNLRLELVEAVSESKASRIEEQFVREELLLLKDEDGDLNTFIKEFGLLNERLTFSEEEFRLDAFVRGLRTETRAAVLAERPSTLQDAIEYANSWQIKCDRAAMKTQFDFIVDFMQRTVKRDTDSAQSGIETAKLFSSPSIKIQPPETGWPIYISPPLLTHLKYGFLSEPTCLMPDGTPIDQPTLPPLSEAFKSFLNNACKESPIVVFFGSFNKGKTFLVNLLAGANLPSDATVHTLGLSFLISKHNELPCVYVDSAGSHSPVFLPADPQKTNQAMLDQMAVTMMTQQALFNIATVHIAVLTELTWLDQDMILSLQARLISEPKEAHKLIVVHNHMNANTDEELRALLQNHVANLNARLITIDGAKVFISVKRGLTTVHVPLANNNTPFGAAFNRKQARYIIAEIMINKRATELPFWEHINDRIGRTLKEFSVEKLVTGVPLPKIKLVNAASVVATPVASSPREQRVPYWEELEIMTENRSPPQQEEMASFLAIKTDGYEPAEARLTLGGEFGGPNSRNVSLCMLQLAQDLVEPEEGMAFVLVLPNLRTYDLSPEPTGWCLRGCLGLELPSEATTSEERSRATFDWEYPFKEKMRTYGKHGSSLTRHKGHFEHRISFDEIGHGFKKETPECWYKDGILTIFFERSQAPVPKRHIIES